MFYSLFRRKSNSVLLLVSACFVSGCRPEASIPEIPVGPVTEVRLVGPVLELQPQPLLAVGGARDTEGHNLFRPDYACLVGADQLVIANVGSSTLRYFSSDGVLLAEVGGSGEGPGDFGLLRSVHRWKADSVAAWDPGLRRITVFDAHGRTGRTIPVIVDNADARRAGATAPLHLYALGTRHFVVVTTVVRGSRPDGFSRDRHFVAFLDSAGTFAANLGIVQGNEVFKGLVVPRSYRYHAAATPDGFWIGNGRNAILAGYDVEGSLIRAIRLPVERRAVSRQEREAAVDAFMATADPRVTASTRERLEETYRLASVVDSLPAFMKLVAGAECLWVQLETPGFGEPQPWLVVAPMQGSARRIMLPPGVNVLDAAGDKVVLSSSDDMDRNEIRVHSIISPDSTPVCNTGRSP